MDYLHEWIMTHFWVAELTFFLVLLFVLNALLKRALVRSHRHENSWWAHFSEAALTPARILLWVIALAFLLDLVAQRLKVKEIFAYSPLLTNGAIVLCFAWFLFRWKNTVYRKMKSQGGANLDHISLELVDKLFTIVILFVSLLVLFSLFRVDIVPLVTFGGIGAAALGFASKDVMANFFGGFTLHASRPFVVHDQIELPQKSLIGQVERIGWYFTSIRALDKKLVYIPNYLFPTEPIINYSRMSHRYLNEHLNFNWEDAEKVAGFIEEIRNLLEHHSEIDQSLHNHVFVSKLADQTVEIEIKAHTFTTRYDEFMQVRQNILLEICKKIDEAGLGRPVTTLKINGNS